MRLWRKKPEQETSASSVAIAALSGAAREELVRVGLKVLTQSHSHFPDRAGIWLEPEASASSASGFNGAFHGLVWDRSAGEDCPPEWKLLSLEPPLPGQLLLGGKPYEQNLEPSVRNAVIGQLVGLRHALWVPVADQSRVKGLILLGSAGNVLAFSVERAQAVAAELALALQAEEQLRGVRIRNAELALVRRVVETRPDPASLDRLLTHLVNDCVLNSFHEESPGAAFAMIGTLQNSAGNSSQPQAVDFRWRAGDEAWTRAGETEPLAKLWRRVLATRQVVGSEPPATWPQALVARVVALPLESEGRLLGTLVAGLPARATSIATLGRMELRARLAAFALQRRSEKEEEVRRAGTEQALLDLVSDPAFLLDPSGRIAATSRGSRELFRRASQTAVLPSGHLSDLFCGRDREHLRKWLQQALDPSNSAPAFKMETPQAELQNGVKVRLHLASRLPGQAAAVVLQPEPELRPQSGTDHAEAELQGVIEWLEEGVILFDDRENVRALNTRF